ncbi:hypothetical protein H2248_000658 [Termitomyces sp. 'cryptogamus']|nr:hypothetical protein H2248_000658 [Termitomyces sp. 'cryptogamus']
MLASRRSQLIALAYATRDTLDLEQRLASQKVQEARLVLSILEEDEKMMQRNFQQADAQLQAILLNSHHNVQPAPEESLAQEPNLGPPALMVMRQLNIIMHWHKSLVFP